MSNQLWRNTFTVVRSGQPRAYADTEYVARITFEHCSPYGPAETRNMWQPQRVDEQRARAAARSFFGYIDTTAKERKHMLDPYLDYFKPIDAGRVDRTGRIDRTGRESPDGVFVAAVWEFRTVSPFTD
jgi:hypothetical protein